MKNQDLNESWR